MNFETIRDTYFAQVHSMMMFIVSAVAVIVAVAQFVSRSWVQNDMNSKIADVFYRVLMFINSTSHKLALVIEEN